MPDVFITRKVPAMGIKLLKEAGLEPNLFDSDLPIARGELLKRLRETPYQAILTTLTEKVDDELLEAAGKQLKIVANFAVGYDNINLGACTRRGIAVSNTPGVLSEATADQAFALLLAVARRLVEGHQLVAGGNWLGWAPTQLLGQDTKGRTLGIIGMGRIGSEVAKRGKGFDMQILYYNRSRNPEAEARLDAQYVSLETLLKESDFVSINTPSTPETHHLINQKTLALMKPNAILVNTARGPIIHEEALVKALKEGRIWGAGLDVFEFEPKVTDELRTLPNVVLAPHLGSATEGTRDAMISLAASAIVAVLRGERPGNLLNPEVPVVHQTSFNG
jgi:glyoxylate reductase